MTVEGEEGGTRLLSCPGGLLTLADLEKLPPAQGFAIPS